MKTIVSNLDNLSKYILENNKTVNSTEVNIAVGDPNNLDFYIGDLNSNNSTIYENITPPEDWQGNRYTFDGSSWTEVEGWINPIEAEIAHLQAQIDSLKEQQ
tara:strand:- start:177 stop:482 length:306 start_codon:yes stop_codon:yes gene_type:complete